MRSLLLAPALFAPLLLGVAACGSHDNGPSFAGAIDTSTVVNVALDAEVFLNKTLVYVYQAQAPGYPDPLFYAAKGAPVDPVTQGFVILDRFRVLTTLGANGVRGVAAVPMARPAYVNASTCEAIVTGLDSLGHVIDADGDGLPDDLKVDYGKGCAVIDSIYLDSLSGIWHIRDVDSGFQAFQFTATGLHEKRTTIATGEWVSNTLNGTESASFLGTGAGHRMNVTFVGKDQTNADTSAVTVRDVEVSSFAPTSGTLALGDSLPPGLLTYGVDFQGLGLRSNAGIPGNFHLLLDTPTPLTYDPACVTGFTAGTLRGLLNGNEAIGFQDVWSGCGIRTMSLFGISG